jgi:isoleucyl-tRNA synthetase
VASPFGPAKGDGSTHVDFPPTSLDAWVLSEFNRTSEAVIAAYHAFDFKTAQSRLYDFCNDTLSAVYLAAVKDRLYCDKPDAPRRRRTQAALYFMTDGLARLLAPILPHTSDETYRALLKADQNSDACVHTETYLPPASIKADPAWAEVSTLRAAALVELEKTRQSLREKESAGDPAAKAAEALDFGVTLPDTSGTLSRFDKEDLADLLGISLVRTDAKATGITVEDRRDQPQCERSWKRDGTVKQRSDGGLLTDRDAAAAGVQ